MSNEQSIRDELVKISGETYCATEDCQGECVADAILASPVIRRIQAEAWLEGAESAFFNPEIRGYVDYPDKNPYIGRGETA